MAKTHVVELKIVNRTGITLEYRNDWFGSGRLDSGWSWPKSIEPGATVMVRCCEKDWAIAGCSGWVNYGWKRMSFFFSFSNPLAGKNGIDVGTENSIWDDMESHYGCPVKRRFGVPEDDEKCVTVDIVSSGGDVNHASWVVDLVDVGVVLPANIQMRDVRAAFASLGAAVTRKYYKCEEAPTLVSGLAESHFKGVARFAEKMLFSHTNLDLVGLGSDGKYMIADVVGCGESGVVDKTLGVPGPKSWRHPGGMQACGSFMAMGHQESADGGRASLIQLYDIRGVRGNQPARLIGSIERPRGINGVAMTKEAGDDGKYIVAGVNGRTLTIYRSRKSSLMPDSPGGDEPVFSQVMEATDFDASGAGIALVTQEDGEIFLISLNADDDGSNSLVNLYALNLHGAQPTYQKLEEKKMLVPGMSDSVRLLQYYIAPIMVAFPIMGAALSVLLAKFGTKYLNSSFRWGKGLYITSRDTFEIYATDRNVLPLSRIPLVGSDKDFSLVVWTNRGA